MQTEVISLGGSVFIQDTIDVAFLKAFKRQILGFRDRKFVIVSGGGKVARMYITALRKEGLPVEIQSYAGIAITRINAKFLANFFMKKQHYPLPRTLREVRTLLQKHRIVFCGSLRYEHGMTSDGTAAEIARHLKTRFINITNVKGVYTKDVRKFPDATFIPRLSFDELYARATAIAYTPGQHFVLDQYAARVIRKGKVQTYIVGKNLANLRSLLRGKHFVGTVIS